ncbi:MAG: D-lyxose/D-mannose family sugar isomerase [bacterium]|nr:D-lyxose/D-mannose family sugar isomerase [bacterium]
MKRSGINKTIKEAISFFKEMNFPLPPYAYFTPQMWKTNAKDYGEVVECRLGWDVTDAGSGDFKKTGRTIFTLRNGNINNIKDYPKTYAQKIMYLQEEQRMPVHYHKSKMEDIINQGGGILQVKTWSEGDKSPLSISLKPGQSVCVSPGTYHQFWAKKGRGPVLSMEISSVNDDLTDNIWLEHTVRFPKIIEDVEKEFLLCSEYEK